MRVKLFKTAVPVFVFAGSLVISNSLTFAQSTVARPTKQKSVSICARRTSKAWLNMKLEKSLANELVRKRRATVGKCNPKRQPTRARASRASDNFVDVCRSAGRNRWYESIMRPSWVDYLRSIGNNVVIGKCPDVVGSFRAFDQRLRSDGSPVNIKLAGEISDGVHYFISDLVKIGKLEPTKSNWNMMEGTYLYTPPVGFKGTVTFKFHIRKGWRFSKFGTVNIDVDPALKSVPTLAPTQTPIPTATPTSVPVVTVTIPSGKVRQQRTVIDNPRGGFFAYAHAGQWDQFGANFASRNDTFPYDRMPAEAVRGRHGRLQHFGIIDNPPDYASFPFSLFQRYNSDEVNRGKKSLNITSQGRPLYFSYDDYVWNNWYYSPVNVADPRFIKFFIKHYIRGQMLSPQIPGLWVGIDNGTFRKNYYGVKTGETTLFGQRVGTLDRNVTWDAGYAQTDAEWVRQNLNMLKEIQQTAPDIRLVFNDVGVSEAQVSLIPEYMGAIAGVIREDFWYFAGGGSSWYRSAFYKHFSRVLQNAANGKVEVHEFHIVPSDTEAIRQAYLAHQLFGGRNFFFAPEASYLEGGKVKTTNEELNPALWADFRARLGLPVADAQNQIEPNNPDGNYPDTGFRLYSRELEGGIVYLNWTGKTKTINLPSNATYYDWQGKNVVTQLTLNDMQGGYVLKSPAARPVWPSINPRRPGIVSNSVRVTLHMDPNFRSISPDAVIRYTLDGSEPTRSSPLYTQPFTLSATANGPNPQTYLVKAKAFTANSESFTNYSSYSITRDSPIVEFFATPGSSGGVAVDSGNEILGADYPLIQLSNPSSQTIYVDYSISGGSSAGSNTGTVTFNPGEQYKHIPIVIPDNTVRGDSRLVEVRLSNSRNANLGSFATYRYSVVDND